MEDVFIEIEKLIRYAVNKKIINKEDKILITNLILEAIGIEDYREFKEEEIEQIEKELIKVEYPTEILDNITEWSAINGKLKDNTVTYRDLLNSKIMGQLIPRTSEITRIFNRKYLEDKIKATDYFYELSKQSNYIRTDRIVKDVHWYYSNKYGNLEITINLSKPEKDPKDIAAAKNIVSKGYPKCLLCKENEGYMGHINHPGRQNHRILKMNLTNEDWYLQYSPYVYYNEHSIVFSSEHRPMKIDRLGFQRLLEFVEKVPHYFIGSNADLPIVGGSILSHDHFQAGRHVFPMEVSELEDDVKFTNYEEIEAGLLKWPMSVIRIRGNKDKLVDLSEKILNKWINYSDIDNDIYANTNGERHNTITPIARFKNGKYEVDLVLRNNRVSEEHPLGIFHPHKEHHNIKKENIGLIEVMGLAVLPGRLKDEIAQIKEIIKSVNSKENIYKLMNSNENIVKHSEWLKSYINDEEIGKNLFSDTDKFLENAIGETFSRVLEDSGVYKKTKEGKIGFKKFIEYVNND